MSPSNRPRIDYTDKDYESLRAAMLALARERFAGWTDDSPNDLGVLLIELFAFMGDTLLYYLDRIANESYLETAVEPRSIVNLLRLIGYELRPATPARADLTLLFADKPSEQVTITSDERFQTSTEPPIVFRYLGTSAHDTPLIIRLEECQEFDPVSLELPAHMRNITESTTYRVHRIGVVEAPHRIDPKRIGVSDGSVWQRFPLLSDDKPGFLIQESLEITTNDEGASWQNNENLLLSSPDDTHYFLRRDEHGTTWVCFGDSRFGKIPAPGEIFARYHVHSGPKGNVPPECITEKPNNLGHLKYVWNPCGASGGAEPETPSQAAREYLRLGPRVFRSSGRAVTAEDYETLALNSGIGIGKARVCPDQTSGNRVQLVAAPKEGGQLSLEQKDKLRKYLDNRRMVTTILELPDPVYVDIFITAAVGIKPYYHLQEQEIVERCVQAILDLYAFEQVNFGDTIYMSKVYEILEALDYIVWVHDLLRFNWNSEEKVESRIPLRWNQLPTASRKTVILEVVHD